MNLKLLDIEKLCGGVDPITSEKAVIKDKISDNGLFQEKIFGSTRPSTCSCGAHYNKCDIGTPCQQCGEIIKHPQSRRRICSYIQLPISIVNPIVYQLALKAGKGKTHKFIDDLIFNEEILGYQYNPETLTYKKINKVVKENESDDAEEYEVPEGCILLQGANGIKFHIESESEKNKDDSKLWNFIYEHRDLILQDKILVIPPEFRPMNKSLGNGNIQDEMNSYYIKILNILKEMNKCNIEDGELSSRFFKILQKQAFKIYEFIYEKLSKKEGIIRRSILGKRVDYSGRSVIAPEPNMSIHECYVPYMMALELYKLDVANLLIKKNMSWCYDDALDQIDNCIRYNKYDLFDILVEATDGKNIILNRQPTLHRHGIQSFKIHITKDNVLKIHPFICNSYNADFDGDTMAAYRPLSDKCEEECIDKLSFEQNILSPSTGKSTFGVNQDIVLGLYTLTSDPEPKIKIPLQWFGGEILGDEIYTTKNRVTFNKILPEGFTFINVPCTKKVIESVINMICRKYKPYVVIETVEKIKELGLYYTTKTGQTLSLDGMDSKILNERTDEIFESDSELSEKIEQLNNKDFVNLMRKNFAYSNFVDSGARGSWGQVSQIIACKGYVSNSKGQIYPEPISHSLLTGLTKKEFFMSGYGTRKGLLDTALYTGDSGYLQRKLVYSNCNCEIGENDDCHTERTLDINFDELKTVYDIDQEKFINNIEGRTVYVEHINNEKPIYKLVIPHDSSKQLAVDFKGTILHIRSPLFCKDEKICRTCYGETYDILHSPYAGISSACAIGEMSTQMILRTFHFSGAVNSAQKDSDEVDDITSGLSRVKKLFNGGNDMTYVDRLLKLYKVYTEYSDKLLLIHFEITLSQMMRDPITNERWRLTNNPSYKVISITNVPQAESWLLALAFSKPKQYIIDGLIDSEIRDINKNGILEKIISNNEL